MSRWPPSSFSESEVTYKAIPTETISGERNELRNVLRNELPKSECFSALSGGERNELRNVFPDERNVFPFSLPLQFASKHFGYGEAALQRALTHGGVVFPSV